VLKDRVADAVALAAGLGLTLLAVQAMKAAEGRPRPVQAFISTAGLSYPSGHAAYALGFVACAVVLVRGGSSLAARFAVVTVAIAVVVFVALSRVYLRAHFLTDVLGGLGLSAAIFSVCGLIAIAVTTCVTLHGRDEHPGHLPDRRDGGVLSLAAWIGLIVVPAWTSYSRVWERLVAVVASVYVLAALLLAGGCSPPRSSTSTTSSRSPSQNRRPGFLDGLLARRA
jgi:hypothetical protein